MILNHHMVEIGTSVPWARDLHRHVPAGRLRRSMAQMELDVYEIIELIYSKAETILDVFVVLAKAHEAAYICTSWILALNIMSVSEINQYIFISTCLCIHTTHPHIYMYT